MATPFSPPVQIQLDNGDQYDANAMEVRIRKYSSRNSNPATESQTMNRIKSLSESLGNHTRLRLQQKLQMRRAIASSASA